MGPGNTGTFTGRFVEDPALKSGNSGNYYCKFTLARSEGYKDSKKTIFVPFTAFGKQAEFICKHFNKGRQIIIGYSVSMTDKYERNGVTYWPQPSLLVNGVEFAGKSPDASNNKNGNDYEEQGGFNEPFNDDIPF